MYFVRTYQKGPKWNPVDSKTIAVYKCSNCGEEIFKDITGRLQQFNINKEIICPTCNSFGRDDKLKNLQMEIEKLTSDKKIIEVKIEMLLKEKEQLSPKE